MVGKQTPIAKFKAGSVQAAIWQNEVPVNGKMVPILKASVQRRYKDKNSGEWKSSASFSRNEIPLAIFCLKKAFEKILGEDNGGANGNSVEEEVVM